MSRRRDAGSGVSARVSRNLSPQMASRIRTRIRIYRMSWLRVFAVARWPDASRSQSETRSMSGDVIIRKEFPIEA